MHREECSSGLQRRNFPGARDAPTIHRAADDYSPPYGTKEKDSGIGNLSAIMSHQSSRSRANTTVTYSETEATDLRAQLTKLSGWDGLKISEGFQPQIDATCSISQMFHTNPSPNQIRDAFRHLNGFQTIIACLRKSSQSLTGPQNTPEDTEAILDLVQNLFGLLAAALQDHWGNRKYFRQRVDKGGWGMVGEILKELLQIRSKSPTDTQFVRERIFGSLFATALEDSTLSGLFTKLRRQYGSAERQESYIGKSSMKDNQDPMRRPEIKDAICKAFGTQALLRNSEILCVILDIWPLRGDEIDTIDGATDLCWLCLPYVLNQVVSLSTYNLLAVHNAGLLSVALPLFLDTAIPSDQIRELRNLALTLLRIGVSNLTDAHFLYNNASRSREIAEVLRLALKEDHEPAYVHFDLSLHGYSSIELPNIGRTFPPSASSGYTLSIWLQIVHFDSDSHTTVFGAFDSSQTCFVLVYLEKDTRNLILQTSVTSSRPSVRFKSFAFEASRWYHMSIVHRRAKATSSSKASLFIDGEFVEQVKAQYPSSPPTFSINDRADMSSPDGKLKPVQVFLGTPQDLASKLGSGVVFSQWRLASAHLFNDILSDDLIAVHRQLGPRYHGNYQDCLGSFQTYRASAALNLRNESLHPGREEKSEIVAAIRSKASGLVPEGKIILNLSPMMVLDDDDRNNIDETQLLKALSKPAAKNLRAVTHGGRAAIAINGAIPSVNEALLHAYGFGVLTGDPTIVVPQSLDDAAWRIGGCAPVGLALLDSARSREEVVCAIDILFGSIRDSWRNSEAMERENGFGVLASLLMAKLGKGSSIISGQSGMSEQECDDLAFEVLSLILNFVGYRKDMPTDSVINNPLAYRILLVDLDVWRTASPNVQKLYYEQFTVFGTGSKHHHFNAKRLSRMRIVKKWLDALKSESFYLETFDYFLLAFRSLLTGTLSADALRSLALYVTYAVHKPQERSPAFPRSAKSVRRPQQFLSIPTRRATTSSSPTYKPDSHGSLGAMANLEVGIRVLHMYSDLLCQQDMTNIKKFARTVTNKWLLHLLADDDPSVVVLATKILARVLVVNGSNYVEKFTDKTGGFIIMRYRLKRWWNVTSLWPILFAILLGRDVGSIDIDRGPFDLYSLLALFAPIEATRTVYPEVLQVITSMLQNGLKSITKNQGDPESPLADKSNRKNSQEERNVMMSSHARNRSMSLQTQPILSSEWDHEQGQNTRTYSALGNEKPSKENLEESARMLHTITRFLADMHSSSQGFRDFTVGSPFVQELLFLLFPIIVSSDVVSPETELHSRDSSLTFNGDDVIIRPLSQTSMKAAPIVRTASVEPPASPQASKAQPLKRGSSYILVMSEQPQYQPSSAKLQSVVSPKDKPKVAINVSNSLVEAILEMIIAVFSDQILSRKDFQGVGLFMKVPPGFQEHQAYFESFILRNTLSALSNAIQLDQKLLWEPRVLTNLARFATHLCEAVYEGWFIDGTEPVIDFLGGLLEYLQRPDVSKLKSVRLCSETILTMRVMVSRIVLLRLSEVDESQVEANTVQFLKKITYWQTVLFYVEGTQEQFLKLVCYLLYTKIMSPHEPVRGAAADLWRTLLVQKPDEASGVLHRIMNVENTHLSRGFQKILELDNASFLGWIDDHRGELDAIFFGNLASFWEEFVTAENRRTEETAKARIFKRRERLKVWVSDDLTRDDTIRRHEISSDHWRSNIYASELLKRQRSTQDYQDGLVFNMSSWTTMTQQLHRPCGLFDDHTLLKWQLDQTEGRNRMRLRLIRDKEAHLYNYQPKASSSQTVKPHRAVLDIREKTLSNGAFSPIAPSPIGSGNGFPQASESSAISQVTSGLLGDRADHEDGFEMVDEPRDEVDSYEDKNRKVMRSLQRGDQVEHVHNISRIIGLEAREGLLIIGKNAMYLLDNFFQRSDGEIVDAWQAPPEERDSYMQMISGREVGGPNLRPNKVGHETQSWLWEDLLSISKRRFLFRDVAIELFFVDGQSYLLTITSPKLRDELHQKLLAKAQTVASGGSAISAEDSWRIEAIRTPEDNPQTLGSRFTSVFSHNMSNPATRRWLKGEISNFHYLMLVNTYAGRTFNDLTQYPVFPWVIADYTSEELDLTNPQSFRDLTKPMGCQTAERQVEFKDRYQSFAEMGDHDSPPFHYGTHYSSAMIVTSYLIRLQPFVQSYLLLQGGSFDHPDRLFYSIEKAWTSASRDNMTDVRELIPEFYYLPDFLLNSNGYEFGSRQGTGGAIDNVALPPWAKGDPKIFIAKQREALESEYVSKRLHHWIDLVFGQKQRGEAALEATNVFHYLSYRGAKNLDEINDPVERLATIGIIHNFGQTPHQVFQRPHPQREDLKNRFNGLDTLADTLTRLPFPLLESEDRVSLLSYATKHDKLLCSGAFRLNIPPNYDKYMEWGFIDGSVRFYAVDSKRLLGLFEHVHQGQLSSAAFADSRTLITAGTDCTISIWAVATTAKSVDLTPKTCLFGHRTAVTTLATSKSFSTLLSASSDGQVLLWDLNRHDLVRKVGEGKPVECAKINDVTGIIMLCRGPEVALYTLNADLILEQNVCVEGDDSITSCAFYEGSGNEFLQRDLIFTGHKRGVVNIWNMTIHTGTFILEHVKRMNHMDTAGFNVSASISCILPMPMVVYVGDDDGRVYEWDCIQRSDGR